MSEDKMNYKTTKQYALSECKNAFAEVFQSKFDDFVFEWLISDQRVSSGETEQPDCKHWISKQHD